MKRKRPALIATFSTTTQAMAAEKYSQEHQLPGRIIPVPKEITAGCGLAWKAAPEDRELLAASWTEGGIIWEALYDIEIYQPWMV